MKQKPKTYEVPRNSGKSIIAYVVILRIIAAILSFAIAIILISAFSSQGSDYVATGVLVGIAAAALNYLIIYVFTMILRGYGELVENMARTTGAVEYLCTKNGGQPNLNPNPNVEPNRDAPAQERKPEKDAVYLDVSAQEGEVVDGAVCFAKSDDQYVKCPFCDVVQKRGLNCCKNCGVEYLYDID